MSMNRVLRMCFELCLLFVATSFSGCGPTGDFPTAATTGKVICEGQPVPFVTVFFEPLQNGKQALVGRQGIANAEADGTFTVSTYGDNDGAVVGRHRVRVGPPRGGAPEGFQCNCVLNSEVDVTEVEIKPGQKNEFELVLKKKTGREPKALPER
jgi:hypothetical protein